ncbi:hypothetical protein ABT56_15985 [Photobacterium aquae]|uniref:Uncharacterized protein n=1 Tax=Photobacterium aquae TaxID=1195763 RepID=A0A0J1JPF3_9GAMM|nr:hypothetical protein [Photobacterium aquae]KLV04107.1 hypothetical protein ABT56_15985 [Photobacterium aquae]
MGDYETLFECTRPEFISELTVSRVKEQGMIKVRLQSENTVLELFGFEDLADSISTMLSAERVVISEELNTGNKEFGTIRIECWADESYSEYWCDSAKLNPI